MREDASTYFCRRRGGRAGARNRRAPYRDLAKSYALMSQQGWQRAVRALLGAVAVSGAAAVEPQLQPPSWQNREGGPLQRDPLSALLPPPSPPSTTSTSEGWSPRAKAVEAAALVAAAPHSALASFNYSYSAGFLAAGGDIATVNVSSGRTRLSGTSPFPSHLLILS